jgi:hypothetical protein
LFKSIKITVSDFWWWFEILCFLMWEWLTARMSHWQVLPLGWHMKTNQQQQQQRRAADGWNCTQAFIQRTDMEILGSVSPAHRSTVRMDTVARNSLIMQMLPMQAGIEA